MKLLLIVGLETIVVEYNWLLLLGGFLIASPLIAFIVMSIKSEIEERLYWRKEMKKSLTMSDLYAKIHLSTTTKE